MVLRRPRALQKAPARGTRRLGVITQFPSFTTLSTCMAFCAAPDPEHRLFSLVYSRIVMKKKNGKIRPPPKTRHEIHGNPATASD